MAQRKVILSADSTCDLGEELKARYDVHYYPFHIILEGQQYQDNVDIHVQGSTKPITTGRRCPPRRPSTWRSMWSTFAPGWTRAMT